MNTLSQEVAEGIESALRLRGLKCVTRSHEKINWDEANQRYLPSDYTYTVSVQMTADSTGNSVLEQIASREDIEAAIGRAQDKLNAASSRTRKAIRTEREMEAE